MLEVYLRDRGIDFSFFLFKNNQISFMTRPKDELDKKEEEFYNSLEEGTIILDGHPVTLDNASEDDLDYLNFAYDLYKDRVKAMKANYKQVFLRITDGLFFHTIEVPDRMLFKEWSHINGFAFLEDFLNNYNLKNKNNLRLAKK